jgi:sigma-B regulation protein RsbU (phosphoserine phosphatase)
MTETEERISAELRVAAQIQASMLPSVFPAFPDRKEFDLHASMVPAKEVGGDFYDFYLVRGNYLAVIIADVSGKGVPAALFMVITKTLIENLSSSLSPRKIFKKVNKRLIRNNDTGMFVTAFIGFYNISTGRFVYSNAGHNPPLLKKRGGDYAFLKSEPCLVLGSFEEAKYTENEIFLEKGDILYLYTDGVTEAMNVKGELFSDAALVEVLNKNKNASPQALLKAVKKEVDAFSEGAQQFDDITMLALKINDELRIAATGENLDKVMDFVTTALRTCNFNEEFLSVIKIAVEEIYMNIANYAYKPESGEAVISVSIDEKITITFEDSGRPYNPLTQAEPDLDKSAIEREIGGLGVYLVKKLMDTVEYSRAADKNILTITKSFPELARREMQA